MDTSKTVSQPWVSEHLQGAKLWGPATCLPLRASEQIGAGFWSLVLALALHQRRRAHAWERNCLESKCVGTHQVSGSVVFSLDSSGS